MEGVHRERWQRPSCIVIYACSCFGHSLEPNDNSQDNNFHLRRFYLTYILRALHLCHIHLQVPTIRTMQNRYAKSHIHLFRVHRSSCKTYVWSSSTVPSFPSTLCKGGHPLLGSNTFAVLLKAVTPVLPFADNRMISLFRTSVKTCTRLSRYHNRKHSDI